MSILSSTLMQIDFKIKEEAEKILAQRGLTLSDVYCMLITKIAQDKCVPFDYELNHETQEVLHEIDNNNNLHYAKNADDLFNQLGI